MEVIIVLAKCSKCNKLYGIRVQQIDRFKWEYTWAFPISEKNASIEGYDKTKVEGKIIVKDSFPGCPYCKAPTFFMCECSNITCWDGILSEVECAWCHEKSVVEGSISNLEGGKF